MLLLLSISLGSHAAGEPQPALPVADDVLHLLAASVWVGGLISFVLGVWSLRKLIQFFARASQRNSFRAFRL